MASEHQWVKYKGKRVDASSVLVGMDMLIEHMDVMVRDNPYNDTVPQVRDSLIRARYITTKHLENLKNGHR